MKLRLDSGFNSRFMLALDCYLPVVGKALFQSCRDDIRIFGVGYVQERWEPFIVNSLNGGLPGLNRRLDFDSSEFHGGFSKEVDCGESH